MTFAEETMWGREVVAPWTGMVNTIGALDGPTGDVMTREFIAVWCILLVAIIVGLKRMWPECALAGSIALVLMCSYFWGGSGIRALTVLLPLWLLIGVSASKISRLRFGDAWVHMVLVLSGLGLFWCELLIANGVVVL
jgi:hypothetical protein